MILAPAVALLVTLALIPALERWARARRLLDIPNERSSHVTPTPRVGGVGLVAGVVAGQLVRWSGGHPMVEHIGVLAAGALSITVLSVADDLRSLPVRVRLAGQGLVGAAVVWQAASSDLLPFGTALHAVAPMLVAVWLVGLVNAYNFMDGIDGIAGGQAAVAALGWALSGWVVGDAPLEAVALTVATSSVGFLCFNWSPARVFMGDGGSAFLGFTFGVMPLAARLPGSSMVAAACFVWPFLFDTTLTLARRLWRGENVFRPHRSHLYQRLTATGLTHAQVSLVYIALAALGLPAGVCTATGRGFAGAAFGLLIPPAGLGLWLSVMRREARAAAMGATASSPAR